MVALPISPVTTMLLHSKLHLTTQLSQMNKNLLALFIFLSPILTLSAQKGHPSVGRPLDIPAVFAGNFGELRPNHFHSGLDFKTQGRTGLPIRAIDDGYVSRCLVSPWGFGRAIYIVHPETGLTSVYGHLESFASKIDDIVRDAQYQNETFSIDLDFEPNEIPVKRGEIIALSGNAGSSGGPHLHMDIRDTATGDALDPMEFYRQYVNDNVAPEVRQIGLYPVPDKGVVDGSANGKALVPAEFSKGFTAWGKVTPGINAYDRMSGTSNIYGVKYLTLLVDGKQVYKRTIDRFSFDSTRAVNTLAYYPDVARSGRWMMVTYVPPTKPLGSMIEAEGDGSIDINEERIYKMEFILEDEMGNKARRSFNVTGKKSDIPTTTGKGSLLNYDGEHSYNNEGVKARIHKGVLYDNTYFKIDVEPTTEYASVIATIGDYLVPLAGEIQIEIPILNDTIADKSKYYLGRVSGNRCSAVDAVYENGVMKGSVDRFGQYAVSVDKTPPSIASLTNKKTAPGFLKYRITDRQSGIDNYYCEIDGQFALFEHDGKTSSISFKMDPKRFKRGVDHQLKITVTDACGNVATHSTKFHW